MSVVSPVFQYILNNIYYNYIYKVYIHISFIHSEPENTRKRRKKSRQEKQKREPKRKKSKKAKQATRISSESDSDTEDSAMSAKKRRRKTHKRNKNKRAAGLTQESSTSESDSDTASSPADMEATEEASNWHRINEVWDKESRPKTLQNKSIVNKMSMQEIFQLHSMFVQNEKSASKDSTARQDEIPDRISFKAKKDDGVKRLHPARWLRLPFADPSTYYDQVPVKHHRKYRNINLEFAGGANKVSDKVILNMHDRRHSLELKHFLSENTNIASKPIKEVRRQEKDGVVSFQDYSWEEPQSMRQVLEAIENYRTCLTLLWPWDQTGNIIGRLLLRYRNIQASPDPKVKVAVTSTYFDKVKNTFLFAICRYYIFRPNCKKFSNLLFNAFNFYSITGKLN